MTQAAKLGLVGVPPTLRIGAGNPEALKYGRMWEHPEYRQVAPGEDLAALFLRVARPKAGAQVVDFGCGTGRGAVMLALLGLLKVTMVDFVRNCLDPGVRDMLGPRGDVLTFLKHDLEQPLPIHSQFGFCTDLMEHIPPDRVDRVLDNILKASQHVFFSIATKADVCGQLIGEPLHLTVRPAAWWREQFAKRDCVVHWAQDDEGALGRLLIYVTAWVSGEDLTKSGVLNVEEREIVEHVKHNIAQGWAQAMPHDPNDFECVVLGGGPSMATCEDDIKAKRAAGMKLITLNGAYHWALDHGLTPSAQIIVDAREFNKRFTKPVVDTCVYLLASQCHPAVFEGLPKDRTYLWHTNPEPIRALLDAQYDLWQSIPGGSTVLLRAIPLMRMLGYSKFHLYGCDSCVAPEDVTRHHAYAQPENDGGIVLPVTLSDGRIFYANPWMVSQAQEFVALIQRMGDLFDLAIYGDGLLAHILTTGAALPEPGPVLSEVVPGEDLQTSLIATRGEEPNGP